MKKFTILLAILFAINIAKAQYVTIPDANFAAYLDSLIPSAMNGNQMDTTNIEVTSLPEINVCNKSIADLSGIQYFDFLMILNCTYNQLTTLPPLPGNLQNINCSFNQLTSLPVLPSILNSIDCQSNQLTTLPALPSTLQYFGCTNNQITVLPTLPNNMVALICNYNQLTTLPTLPDSLIYLDCNVNFLTVLPTLPSTLEALQCGSNQLSSLPVLPNTLQYFVCAQNQLASLPNLPNSIYLLDCSSNQLLSLPGLPDSLSYFICSNNQISCFPFLPNSLINGAPFSISGNPFTCLPNYVPAMDTATLAYPLCFDGDSLNNPYGCNGFEGIVGYIYKDLNFDCLNDSSDQKIKNVHELLYDNNGNLIRQTYSALNGIYNFSDTAGTYTVKIDTTNTPPFVAQCINPGYDTTITLLATNPIASDVNFSVECKPGFDVGVQSVVHNGNTFPGLQHDLIVNAGDLSQWYNLNCASGIGGQVQITINGPVAFDSIAFGSLTPTIAGNVYTYNIADFGTINNATAFGLILSTDTTANTGDTICVSVSVTPTIGDNNTTNNNFNYCYNVVNSLDPNFKEVYPVDVLPGYQDYFTYTVHFQNTGSASAQNIRVTDVLDSKLDLSTFQLINYSHQNTVSLIGKNLTVRFPNIMLPDSASNPEASQGFFQYRIKQIAGLISGTQIHNTASIYFDYNPAIVTNTTTNLFTTAASVQENIANSTLNIYPNPASSNITISTPIKSTIEILNIQGQTLKTITTTELNTQFNISNFASGVYIVKAKTEDGVAVRRFIKE
jgi:uncharacterized repeat protein (TIGR01451 family)